MKMLLHIATAPIIALVLFLSSLAHPTDGSNNPRTLAASELEAIRGGDDYDYRTCHVPLQCRDDPDMIDCGNYTPAQCITSKWDSVPSVIKDCTKDSPNRVCREVLPLNQDCRLVYTCVPHPLNPNVCTVGAVFSVGVGPVDCIDEAMPYEP